MNKGRNIRVVLYFVSIFLLSIVFTSLFKGFEAFFNFRNIVDPSISLNISNIRYFTKESLIRAQQQLTATNLPTDTKIPSFWLYVDENSIDSLNSDLPASGKEQYVSGHIKISDITFESDIKLKYRGGLPLHWLNEKKSFRVKLPEYKTYLKEQIFDLVNITSSDIIVDLLTYEMAREIGLLSPDYFPARVFVNNRYNGLHFFLSGINESFLRKNNRMPGSIYSGDTSFISNPFGGSQGGVNEVTFSKIDNNGNEIALLWEKSRLWKKSSSRNLETKTNRDDIIKFIDIINSENMPRFMDGFEKFFDKELFYKYWALDSITGTYHHDMFHNHKIYFDPYKGKFEPIAWDLRFWSIKVLSKDSVEYPLLRQVKLNPILEYERDKTTFEIMKKFTPNEIGSRITDSLRSLIPELEADPLRQFSTSVSFTRENKAVPLSLSTAAKAENLLASTFLIRHKYLTELFDSSFVGVSVEKAKDDLNLTISVSGNSPAHLDIKDLIAKFKKETIKVEKIWANNTTEVNSDITLYPGRKILKGNVYLTDDTSFDNIFGKDRTVASPLHYKFRIVNSKYISPQKLIENLTFKNAITGSKIKPNLKTSLPTDMYTSSIHPWNLNQTLNQTEEVVLKGILEIKKDTQFSRQQKIHILPGTIFRMHSDTSLIFKGKVIADGTEEYPITFEPFNSNSSWGGVAIHGKGAKGSKFNNIIVRGGSILKSKLVEYPAQFNIHDVDEFTIDGCYILNNSIGDDAMHIAYSKGRVTNCKFENTNFDALDIDISKIEIQNVSFSNIGNDAIDSMNSIISINGFSVIGAQDKCLSIGESSDVDVNNASLENCRIGIAIKDQSKASLDRIDFSNFIESAISLYQKNTRYGYGGEVSGTNLSGLLLSDIDIGNNSKSFITEEHIN